MITIALLTIMAVAFLTSSSLDRATASSFATSAKAQLAARTAVNVAITQLATAISSYPDSATAWEKVTGLAADSGYEGTILYYHQTTPETAAAAPAAAAAPPLYVLPLISGAAPVPTPASASSNKAARETALQSALTLTVANSFDLNHARFASDTQGWIGSSPDWINAAAGPTTPQPFKAKWIDLANTDGRITGRYAYWVEDESFKPNVNLMGNTPRGSMSLGTSPSEVPLQGMLKTAMPGRSNHDSVADEIFGLRATFPNNSFFEFRALNHVGGQPTLADTSKFSATLHSGSMNTSRSGSKRINLNKVVTSSVTATDVRRELDQIGRSITYHLPNFGQRFYRLGADKNTFDVPSTGSPSHRDIYVEKLAANIRDYIDPDFQPTVVNNDAGRAVRIGSAPTNALITQSGSTSGPSEVIAIGKERIPRAQEYAIRVRQISFGPKTGPFANYTISIDHYVEFWNESNRDVNLSDLGSNPFLLIANQPGWDAGGATDIPDGAPRDLVIPLANAKQASSGSALTKFPAGSVTVITTDPTLLPALTPDPERVYQVTIPPNLRTYTGQTQRKNSKQQLRLNLKTRTTSSSDYETEIALGNDAGILESAWGAGAITAAMSINIDDPAENRFDDTKWHFQGASLKGNVGAAKPYATTGDPRTNAEQLSFNLNGAAANNDKTRYYSSGLNSANIPGNSTLTAPNAAFVAPGTWVDPSSSSQTAAAAPEVIGSTALTSIGQLGDLFDPVRSMGDSNDIALSRSGGRTLKIGQTERFDATANPGGVWDADSNSASREWTAWRLTDVFSTSDAVQLDGRINVNGINRDNGAGLKAALFGYAFQATPDSDPQIASAALTDAQVQSLIDELRLRMANDPSGPFAATAGPLFERGEVSEMPVFNTGTQLTGKDMATVYDRGREELFRRLSELITTRGNVFTVYAVGQSLAAYAPPASPTVIATSRLKVTFRVDPVWNAGVPSDPFDPTKTDRFQKPDRYATKILYAGE
ncbi:MAG TPA: hypothetical protein VK993_01755 [Chthoniobacterales bacterium]|nr:hypothetical protein [Chthoniobacterales bacterium]